MKLLSDIPGLEPYSKYRVHFDGKIEYYRNKSGWKVLKSHPNTKDGRLKVSIKSRIGWKNLLVSRVVAMAFVECPGNFEDFEAHHIDEDYLNNVADNLEWLTREEHLRIHKRPFSEKPVKWGTKQYILENIATGEVVVVKNLSEFAKESGMNCSRLYNNIDKPLPEEYLWKRIDI